MTGVILASADRAGRQFPLTIAAAPPLAAAEIASVAADWFDDLEAAGIAAREEGIDGDALATRLATLPYPAAAASGDIVGGMRFWMSHCASVEIDPGAPDMALRQFFPEDPGDT
jgi:type VI secretion system protein ImpM